MRRMQVSEVPMYVFVEGSEDRYFYSRIAGSECDPSELDYSVITGEEIHDGDGGGKNVLIGFFDYLEQRNSLANTFEGKSTIAMFFVDKDIDDLLGVQRISDHLVYTELYDVESYLFNYGDIGRAAAGAASLDINSVRSHLGDYPEWRRRAAESWRSWVTVCVFAQAYAPSAGSFYGRPKSQVNECIYGSVNSQEYADCLLRLQLESGMTKLEFEELFCKTSYQVHALYNKGQCDRVFKGKWYLQFLIEDVRKIAGKRRFKNRRLFDGLRIALEQTLDWEEPWALDLRMPVREIINKLKNCDFGS